MKEQVLLVEYIGMSTNDFYKLHYGQKSAEMKKVIERVKMAIDGVEFKKIEYPVKITFQPILGGNLTGRCKRAYDIANYSSTIKMIEDTLVKLGYFTDDSNKYVCAHNIELPIVDRTLTKTGIAVIITEYKKDDNYINKLMKKHNIDL